MGVKNVNRVTRSPGQIRKHLFPFLHSEQHGHRVDRQYCESSQSDPVFRFVHLHLCRIQSFRQRLGPS